MSVTPESLPLAYKIQQNHCTCHLQASQQHCSPAPGISPPWTEQSATCRVSQQDQRRRRASGWELAVCRFKAKAWFCHQWPVKRRWQLETCTVQTVVSCKPPDADQQAEVWFPCVPPRLQRYKEAGIFLDESLQRLLHSAWQQNCQNLLFKDESVTF